MKTKTARIIYWILLSLFLLAMLGDAFGGITQQQAGKDVMAHLGFPMYVLIIFGIAKLLGVIALLQPRFDTLKEWAYAGFTINFVGALACRGFMGDKLADFIPPLIMLVYTFVTYYFWKQYKKTENYPVK